MKMTQEQLYHYSHSLIMLETRAAHLRNLNIYRYARFIKASPRGANCSLARAAIKTFPEEEEKFLEILEEIERMAKQMRILYETRIKDNGQEE